MGQLVAAQNLALLQNLEGIHLLGVLHLDKEHFTVAALANDFDGAEVAHTHIARAGLRAVAHLLHLVDRLLVGSLLSAVK